MKLLCIRDVIMSHDASVAFKAGEMYDFNINQYGEISRQTEHGMHMFKATGPDGWATYFKFELEEV